MASPFSSLSPNAPALLISPARPRKEEQRSHRDTAAYLTLSRTAYLNQKISCFSAGSKQLLLFPLPCTECSREAYLNLYCQRSQRGWSSVPSKPLGTISLWSLSRRRTTCHSQPSEATLASSTQQSTKGTANHPWREADYLHNPSSLIKGSSLFGTGRK